MAGIILLFSATEDISSSLFVTNKKQTKQPNQTNTNFAKGKLKSGVLQIS